VAFAPDLDFIPQILTGVRYHHGFSHSLIFALGFSIVTWIWSYFLARQLSRRLFLLTLMSYGSHLLLDFFTDGGPGIQLLWPFTEEYFRSLIAIFPSTHHSQPLIHLNHIIFVGFELSYSVILLGVIWKHQRHHR
jgi:inner membrane protein